MIPLARTIDKCLEAFQKIGDPDGQAECLLDLGRLDIDTGNPDMARDPLEQSLALRKKQQDLAGTADCLRQLGRLALATGDLPSRAPRFRTRLQDPPAVEMRPRPGRQPVRSGVIGRQRRPDCRRNPALLAEQGTE